jgi:hypothetical protein
LTRNRAGFCVTPISENEPFDAPAPSGGTNREKRRCNAQRKPRSQQAVDNWQSVLQAVLTRLAEKKESWAMAELDKWC